jgi:hypothetical protein
VQECGLCPVFASFTLAFGLQLRKKQGKTSVRVRKTSVRLRKTSVIVSSVMQYTLAWGIPTYPTFPAFLKYLPGVEIWKLDCL